MQQPQLGQKVVELRKKLNMTQEDLANKTDISVRTIQRIEQGEVTPRLTTMKLISEALDYNLNGMTTNNRIDKTLLFFVHLSSIFIFIIFPILVLVWNNSMSKMVEIETKRAINFQISYLILILSAVSVTALGIVFRPLFVFGAATLIVLPVTFTICSVRNMLLLSNRVKAKYLFEINYIKLKQLS